LALERASADVDDEDEGGGACGPYEAEVGLASGDESEMLGLRAWLERWRMWPRCSVGGERTGDGGGSGANVMPVSARGVGAPLAGMAGTGGTAPEADDEWA